MAFPFLMLLQLFILTNKLSKPNPEPWTHWNLQFECTINFRFSYGFFLSILLFRRTTENMSINCINANDKRYSINERKTTPKPNIKHMQNKYYFIQAVALKAAKWESSIQKKEHVPTLYMYQHKYTYVYTNERSGLINSIDEFSIELNEPIDA